MIGEPIQNSQQSESNYRLSRQLRNVQQSQECLYEFLLDIVRKWPPEEVLLEFKRLFIYHVDSVSSIAMQAVYNLVFSNDYEEFHHTLKRCCYILINNWDATRHYKPIQELVELFSDASFNRYTASPTLKRLRFWINDFVKSEDFEELKLFTARYEDRVKGPWVSRYTSYLLVPQYADLNNPVEQREAARALSKQLKDRFKFDLAMYVARSQMNSTTSDLLAKNPTALGDNALRLIKLIVARRGRFSYVNIANIFLRQIENITYREFKQSLQRYLIFSVDHKTVAEALSAKLSERLNELYTSHDQEVLSDALILRTCNRILDVLTTENQNEPSPLLIQILSQGSPITLVIVLLKIILISRYSRTHLEARIAQVIKYYQDYPEDECDWIIHFLEIFNITFTIYAENVQYNLVKLEGTPHQESAIFNPDMYRVFSQLRHEEKLELFPGLLPQDDELIEALE